MVNDGQHEDIPFKLDLGRITHEHPLFPMHE